MHILMTPEARADQLGKREHILTCIHEAGHVVAARHFSLPVAWVSIDPNFIWTNPLAKRSGCASSHAVAMVIASTELEPIMARGFVANERERAFVRGYCIEVMSGPLAEAAHDVNFDSAVARRDMEQVGWILRKVGFSKSNVGKRFRLYHKDAEAFVLEHWNEIIGFAQALSTRRTILEVDIDQVIASAHEHLEAA